MRAISSIWPFHDGKLVQMWLLFTTPQSKRYFVCVIELSGSRCYELFYIQTPPCSHLLSAFSSLGPYSFPLREEIFSTTNPTAEHFFFTLTWANCQPLRDPTCMTCFLCSCQKKRKKENMLIVRTHIQHFCYNGCAGCTRWCCLEIIRI